MSVYTKAGDNGRSSTATRTSLSKDSPIFELLGTLDELTSNLGVAKLKAKGGIKDIIEEIQKNLVLLCGEVAGGKKFATSEEIRHLEASIDSIESVIPEFSGFILPGKTESGAQLDIARTIARHAERAAVAAKQFGGITKSLIAWLNRLSDLLYVMARLSDKTDLPQGFEGNVKSIPSSGIKDFCDKAAVLCKAVREYAKEKGVSVVVAVCDMGGNQVSLQRNDDAFIASVDIAVNKAYTSASLKMSTKEVGTLAQPGAPLYGIQHTNGGKIVIFGGGELLKKNGTAVGAIGVSGGTLEEDTAFAEYGAQYFEREM